jgi:hypothetical protein
MQGAVLGGGGDLLVGGQVGENGTDLGGSHVFGAAFMGKEDTPCDPTERGDCRAVAHLFEP